MIPKEFRAIFKDPAPGLLLKWEDAGFPQFGVSVKHCLGGRPTRSALAKLNAAGKGRDMPALREFYTKHDGAELCIRRDPQAEAEVALIKFQPIERLHEFTAKYMPGGEYDWTIDHNSYKRTSQLYRGYVKELGIVRRVRAYRWIAFALLDRGPGCLTTFLSGPNEGSVFFLAPEPGFNILRPVAKSFDDLLRRIGSDLAGFLRLCRVRVTFVGADGSHYGLDPLQYLPDARRNTDFHGRDPYP
jgi:hypothetical protein